MIPSTSTTSRICHTFSELLPDHLQPDILTHRNIVYALSITQIMMSPGYIRQSDSASGLAQNMAANDADCLGRSYLLVRTL